MNPRRFTRAESARATVKGRAGFYTLWFDDSTWSLRDDRLNPQNEFEFAHAQGDRYAYVVAERIEVPRRALRKAVTDNVKRTVRDVQVTFDEIRRVNDVDVLCLEMEGTSDGVPLKWIGYVWSGQRGTLQAYAFTGRSLFEEFRTELTEFLNGLVVEVQP
jgi:hypothetical protein